MTGPLEGIRILDLTAVVSGPSTTMILADQGADIIKIENTTSGDYTRLVSTRRGGFSASFLNNNRNKRSVSLNLKTPEGVEIIKRLATEADVIIQNFRPGVMERLGIGEEQIREVAPDIVYVSISGFGHEGPYAKKPVYDPLIQALSGLATVQAGSDEERPRLVRTILPDKLTGYVTSQAICAALLGRARGKPGQHVKVSMLDALIAFLWGSDMGGHTFVGDEFETETAQSFIDLIYETKDGYISVAVQNDKEWTNLCRALQKPEWLEDPRFATANLRQQNINDRLSLTQEALLQETAGHWLDVLEENDVPCAPVLRRRDMINHPQIVANEIIQENDHPEAGRLRQARAAAQFSKTPTGLRIPAARLGAHTQEVLAELGYDNNTLADLASKGAVKMAEKS